MDLHELEDDQLDQLRRDVLTEQERRQKIINLPEQVDDLVREYQNARGRKDGDPWEPPVTPLDAYPQGAVAAFEGVQRRSKQRTNMARPDNPEAWGAADEEEDDA